VAVGERGCLHCQTHKDSASPPFHTHTQHTPAPLAHSQRLQPTARTHTHTHHDPLSSKYTKETLPRPKDSTVEIKEVRTVHALPASHVHHCLSPVRCWLAGWLAGCFRGSGCLPPPLHTSSPPNLPPPPSIQPHPPTPPLHDSTPTPTRSRRTRWRRCRSGATSAAGPWWRRRSSSCWR